METIPRIETRTVVFQKNGAESVQTMNRDEKIQAINQIVGKLYQYEEVYAQMTFQSNRMLNDELSTSLYASPFL